MRATRRYCSPAGAPPSCRYTASVTETETKAATVRCSRGAPPSRRYTVTETKPATLAYVGTMPVGYTCGSGGWKLSGTTCTRSVTRYGTASYSCGSGGWSRSGSTCSRTVTKSVTRYGTARYTCGSGGWSRSGSTCSRTVSVTRYQEPTVALVCDTGYVRSRRCYSYPPVTESCDTDGRFSMPSYLSWPFLS